MTKKNVTISGFWLLFLILAGPVFAQTESRTATVMNRERPDFDPLGISYGGFLIFPSLDISEYYNDNIFATQVAESSDFITSIRPEVRVSSNWNSHFLQLRGQANIERHASNEGEDVEEFTVGTSGRLDIRRASNVTAGLEFASLTEDRGSPDDVNGVEPTQYNRVTGSAGFSNRWNRFKVESGVRIRQFDFDDVRRGTGAVINNDDRDRDEYRLNLRGGYEIVPEYEAYAELIGSKIDYDSSVDDSGVNRDSDGYELRLGARIDLTELLFGDVYAGYINRDYDAVSLRSVEEVTSGVDLTWNVTRLTTLTGTVRREVSETTLTSASGNLQTSAGAQVDHELLRSLILSAGVGVSTDKFEGTNREDDYFRSLFQARYLLNRNLQLTVRYEYTDRNSSLAGADYDRNILLIRLRGQL